MRKNEEPLSGLFLYNLHSPHLRFRSQARYTLVWATKRDKKEAKKLLIHDLSCLIFLSLCSPDLRHSEPASVAAGVGNANVKK